MKIRLFRVDPSNPTWVSAPLLLSLKNTLSPKYPASHIDLFSFEDHAHLLHLYQLKSFAFRAFKFPLYIICNPITRSGPHNIEITTVIYIIYNITWKEN